MDLPRQNLLAPERTVTAGTLITTPWLVMTWNREDQIKPHVVPASLKDEIEADIFERMKVRSAEERPISEKFFFDFGGMMNLHEPRSQILVDGLTIEFLSGLVDELHYALTVNSGLPRVRRVSSGPPYWKIHGAYGCFVFESEQRDRLIEQLEPQARRNEIYSLWKRFNESLK